MPLITIDAARKHLRIDDETDEIQVYINAAEEYAQQFLNRRVHELTVPVEDETGIVVNDLIRAGILLILGHLYLNRETVTDVTVNEVPMGALHLLQPYRIDMGV